MKKAKSSDRVKGDKLFRSKKFKKGYGDPYEEINGISTKDGFDRSELSVPDQVASPIDQDFVEDFDGDEDFYGDDEENQSGAPSYTATDQQKYLGQGEWVDKKFGEHQYDHKGDVEYVKKNLKSDD